MSDVRAQQDWWQASDGRWYPPELHPNYRPTGIPPSSLPPLQNHYGSNPAAPLKPPTESLPSGSPPVRRSGTDDNWYPHVPQADHGPYPGASTLGSSTPASGRHQGGIRVLLGVLVLILLGGVAFGIYALIDGGSKANSACALLTSSQKSELLDHPPTVRDEGNFLHTPRGATVRGATLCTVIPWPITSQRSFTSLFLVMKPAPVDFPSALDRRLGQAMEVRGQTAWWIPSANALISGRPLPESDYFLVATKDGWLVSVQVTNIQNAKSIAVRTMSDSLGSI